MSDDLTPILVGAGQVLQRDVDPGEALEPLDLMAAAARRAAEDTGVGESLLGRLDSIAVVNIIAWDYGNAPRLLAERLGARPREEIYTAVGGNTPQLLVNETASKIAAGSVRVALLAGAEAIRSLVRAGRSGSSPSWAKSDSAPAQVVGDRRPGSSDHEMAHGMHLPVRIYPLFENALRAHRGLDIEAHRVRLGALWAGLSKVAAGNPYAWFREPRTAAEIATPTAANRMVGFPYTKYMNAIMEVDQAAAVLMTSAAAARELGIPESRWVYLRGCADAIDHWFVSDRVDYHSSPAIRAAGRESLAMAGLEIADIDHFDLYSCFPSAVQIACDMLGIPEDDPRPLTVTGGLAYHGGPGSNYTMHAIATMMDKLRAAPGSTGLINALGWYLTKHSVGVYSTRPPDDGEWSRKDPALYQAELDRTEHPVVATEANGRGVIETYTVVHDRSGAPEKGIIIGRLEDGRRFLANTPTDRSVLEDLMRAEGVGRSGTVSSQAGRNTFVPD